MGGMEDSDDRREADGPPDEEAGVGDGRDPGESPEGGGDRGVFHRPNAEHGSGDLHDVPETIYARPREVDRAPEGEEPMPGEGVRRSVVDEAMEEFERVPGHEGAPERSFVAERFFDWSYLEDEQLDRYWLEPPYAYASMMHHGPSNTKYYNLSEPVLDETEEYVKRDLRSIAKDELADEPVEEMTREEFDAAVVDVVEEYGEKLPAGSRHKIGYHLTRDFRGMQRVDALLKDDNLEDVSADGADVPVFVYHKDHRDMPTNVVLDDEEMKTHVRRLAQRAGEMISYSEPIVSATLPDNHRVQLTLGGDVAPRGSNFTIRLFSEVPFTPIDLVMNNTFSLEEMAFLWLCIEHRRSIMFVGPTASGKTTSMNAVSLFIEPYSKVVTIEKTRELSIPHDNWVAGMTRGSGDDPGDVTMNDLLGAALHQRPEYILVGEIRNEPDVMWTFLQSVFTGHSGSTTFHATDVEEALNRFRAEPFALPEPMIGALDLVSIQKQVRIGDRRLRRCTRIAELKQDDDEKVEVDTLFRRDPETDEHVAEGYMDSHVLADVADDIGWSEVELVEELSRRREFLEYLLRAEVLDYRDVWAALFAYRRDRDAVVESIDDGSFDPSEIEIDFY